MEAHDEQAPQKRPSFWSSMTGMITAMATAAGAAATLITALYSTGIAGQIKPQEGTVQAAPVSPAAPAQPQLDQAKREAEEAARQKEIAESMRARAEAESARARREKAAAALLLEAQRQAEVAEARKKADEAEAARVRAEVEMERLRREQAEAAAKETAERAQAELAEARRKAQEAEALRAKLEAEMERRRTAQLPSAPPEPPRLPPALRGAILGYRVLHISNTEMVIEVQYTADRSRAGSLLAGATLRYRGRPISGYRPAAIVEERGGVRIPLTVRTELGRESDELEVFLYREREKVAARTFPFPRTFAQIAPAEGIHPATPGYRPTTSTEAYPPVRRLLQELLNVRSVRGS